MIAAGPLNEAAGSTHTLKVVVAGVTCVVVASEALISKVALVELATETFAE